ncbi:hypothetical protein B9Z19DRAFT_1069834 [Tuber borchii]|uniref:Uncharacterized protein n=1 Tax=Tuber borchii TaxID=42251 RepID=A0A2T6ZA71_TUBBO|nr:hypothetical protein B9Z19DRAFT_1069834 [Tuber borchii]
MQTTLHPGPYISRRLTITINTLLERGRARQEGRGNDGKLKRGFLGMNFPQNPRACSSSAGVLGNHRDIDISDGDGDFNDSRYSSGGKAAGSNPNRARMAWLRYNGLLQEKWRVSNHGNIADPHLHENYVPMKLNNSEGHYLYDSSSHTGEVYYLTPTTNQRGISIGRIHSRHGQQALIQHMRWSLEQRRLGTVNRVLEESAPTKSPPGGFPIGPDAIGVVGKQFGRGLHRYNEHSHWHSSITLQTKLFTSPDNSSKPAVTHMEYVNRIRSQKVASMYSNPDYALGELKSIRLIARRPAAKVDLHDIFRELTYRARMEKRPSLFTAASTSEKVLTDRHNEELRSPPFMPPSDEAPLARFGLEESNADSKDQVVDGIGEVNKVWRDIKVRKYGPGGGVALRG